MKPFGKIVEEMPARTRISAEHQLYLKDREAWGAAMFLRNTPDPEKKKIIWGLLDEKQQDAIRAMADLLK